jgi:hypothetical protein
MSPCFNGFPIPTDFGLWLQWSWVQIPSLTLPNQPNPKKIKCHRSDSLFMSGLSCWFLGMAAAQ